MTNGSYLEDSKRMIRFAGDLIQHDMSDDDVVKALLFFSNGLEKLLKHGLKSINPLFIQQIADFKHSAAIYRDRFHAGYAGAEVDKSPNQDVITFRASLNRLKVFSPTANNISQLLHTVITWRDVLAHRPSTELDLVAVRRMLTKDAYRIVDDFCRELGIETAEFFGERNTDLDHLSEYLIREDIFSEYMVGLLAKHREIWEAKKSDDSQVKMAEKTTAKELSLSGDDFSNEPVPCPACGQGAVVRIEPNWDYSDGESYISGVYPERVQCHHCDLILTGYEEFDYINLDETLAQNY